MQGLSSFYIYLGGANLCSLGYAYPTNKSSRGAHRGLDLTRAKNQGFAKTLVIFRRDSGIPGW